MNSGSALDIVIQGLLLAELPNFLNTLKSSEGFWRRDMGGCHFVSQYIWKPGSTGYGISGSPVLPVTTSNLWNL
eukprot:1377868-Amorphochlora_amoeboformis.AAC.1